MELYIDPEERQLLASLTVVICSYNRPDHLNETLSFLGGVGVKVIAVDGSPHANEALLKGESSWLEYIHAPHLSYEDRLGLAAKIITTPYALTMCDDEYYIPSAIAASIKFLNNHPDYSSCTGEAVGFSVRSGKLQFHSVYSELKNFSSSSHSPITRFRRHLARYRVASYYSVVRTQFWSRAWSSISKRRFSPWAMSELQFEAAISFAGKLKVLPELMWWRNEVTPPHVPLGNLNDGAIVHFLDWWKNSKYHSERAESLRVMSDLLLGLSETPQQLSSNIVHKATRRAFQGYFRYNWIPRQHARNLVKSIASRFWSASTQAAQDSENEVLLSILGNDTNVDATWFHAISLRIKAFYVGDRVPVQ